jgi:hypothetical protein
MPGPFLGLHAKCFRKTWREIRERTADGAYALRSTFSSFQAVFLPIKFFFTINAPEPPIIGHLKSGSYLAGILIKNFIGDYISVLMAAAAKSLAILLAGL